MKTVCNRTMYVLGLALALFISCENEVPQPEMLHDSVLETVSGGEDDPQPPCSGCPG